MTPDSQHQPTPPTRRVGMDGTIVFFVALAAASGAAVWLLKGAETFSGALGNGLQLLLWILPVLIGTVFIGAYARSLIPQAMMERWLGEGSGMRGLMLATIAGAITPGGPFAAFPLVIALYRTGAAFPVCVTYLTAWSVLGLNRALVWELPLIGPDFVLIRLAVSLPLPIIAGLIARLLCRWLVPTQ
ncbi:MAG: permease [Aquisalimonadaceae bacterium]